MYIEAIYMGKTRTEDGQLLYHLTALRNLDSIIQYGLLPRSQLIQNGMCFEDVADPSIIDKRSVLNLDRYVPFHFHPYSSYDVAVKNSHHEEFIYICIYRTYARRMGFLVLPMHPLSVTDHFELLPYDEGIKQIDWDAMEQSATLSPYHKSVHMAECLTDQPVPVNGFFAIYVRNEDVQKIVQEKLKSVFPPYRPHVNVQRKWFPDERM